MKLKLDENLGAGVQELFRQRGHDVVTVADQRLCAAPDAALIQACRREQRCLVTLDLDFGNPVLFKPSDYAGIAVLRLPRKPSPADLLAAVESLLSGLEKDEIGGKLWLVQPGRIRKYQEPEQE
jgi:hypothetical protein